VFPEKTGRRKFIKNISSVFLGAVGFEKEEEVENRSAEFMKNIK
jgi:hypothetical protein